MVRQFHDGMTASILNGGDYSDVFPVSNGVKQDCVLAPTLFNMMFSAMLTDAFSACDQVVGIKYRIDHKLFNLFRLHTFTKVKDNMLRDFLFADECALNAGSEPEMQDSTDKFSTPCDSFSLTRSTKTEVMHQPAPGYLYVELSITVKGQKLLATDKLTYISGIFSRLSTLMIQSTVGLPKPVPVLEDYVTLSGNEGESALR